VDTPRNDSPVDVTLEIMPSGGSGSPGDSACRVALVQGSTAHLSSETQSVLRSRLRAASLIMFAGLLAFLVKALLLDSFTTPGETAVLINHAAVTLLAGVVGVALCRKCSFSMVKLRIAEALAFGAAGAFFVVLQSVRSLAWAENFTLLPAISPPWLLLIFIYALFIPNTWRRAGLVTGCMAAVPVVMTIALAASSASYRQALAAEVNHTYILENAMLLAVGVISGTFGVYTIGQLRREAFRAKQLGQYRLKHLIGAGGMGEVYLAEHQLLKRPCAIKVIRPEKAGDPRALARFEREVRATAVLSHWNTVEIFDYGNTDDGTFYYAMEYLPGMNVGELVERYGPLPPARAIYLLMQTCEALREAHEKGLVHRDIKPGNIFAAHRGGAYDVAKLVDFGLAKPLLDTESPELTQEGGITGSPLFMSPEQAVGEVEIDGRSDIYSLGAVAYYLITGKPPFYYDKPLKLVIAHAHDDVPPPSQIHPGVPADLERVILRCLEKSRSDRYTDVEEVRQALAQCESSDGWSREAAADWWRDFGCPQKKALDQQALQPAAV
jgi:serine/threonine-protein kinase